MTRKVVGLDIGTCFIRTIIAEIDENEKIEIIGVSKIPSQGVRNGVIVNIDAAMNAIQKSVMEAEDKAAVEVRCVYTDIGGSQIESFDSNGQVGVDTSKKSRMTEIDVGTKARALESARQISIPLDKTLLHLIPQTYIIDGIENQNPLGMLGVRLEVKTHLVTASITTVENIRQSVERAGFEIGNVTLKTLAASYATIHDDEKELGSILIDLGGGTTDVMVLNKGAPVFTTSIPAGGNRVTSDIATVMGIPVSDAERLKLEHGACWLFGGEENEEVIIPGVGGLPPESSNRRILYEIISARMEEILTAVKKEVVRKSNLKTLNGSIVLTGGGALMKGVLELTQSIWKTSAVRVACSSDFGGIDDCYRDADYATVVGLVLANKKEGTNQISKKRSQKQGSKENGKGFLAGLSNVFNKFK